MACRTKDDASSTHVDAMFGSLPEALHPDGARMTYVYDYKRLCHALAPFGLAAPAPIRDVMLAQYLLDPDQKAWGLDRIGDAWGLDRRHLYCQRDWPTLSIVFPTRSTRLLRSHSSQRR